MQLQTATAIADRIKEALSPHCERIQVAGSVRRKKSEVKDIEIVCVPKQVVIPGQTDIFGDASLEKVRDPEFIKAVNRYRVVKGQPDRGKYIKCQGNNDIAIDIFMATPETWGYILLLRTGSREFNIYLMQHMKNSSFQCREGRVFFRNKPIAVKEEKEMFLFAGIAYREPEKRL